MSIAPENNRALNQGLLHLWSKFGDPSLNGWWIIARTSSWLTDTRTHTHIHTQATTIPEGQNWPRVKNEFQTSALISLIFAYMWYVDATQDVFNKKNRCYNRVFFLILCITGGHFYSWAVTFVNEPLSLCHRSYQRHCSLQRASGSLSFLTSITPTAPGPWFNIKTSSYQYRKSHCGDKTVVR